MLPFAQKNATAGILENGGENAPLFQCNRYCFRIFVLEFKIKDMLISALFKTLLSYAKKRVFI